MKDKTSLLSLLLIVNGMFAAYLAASWAFVFGWALKHDSYLIYEPNLAVLRVEFIAAVALTIIGLVSCGMVYYQRFKEE